MRDMRFLSPQGILRFWKSEGNRMRRWGLTRLTVDKDGQDKGSKVEALDVQKRNGRKKEKRIEEEMSLASSPFPYFCTNILLLQLALASHHL